MNIQGPADNVVLPFRKARRTTLTTGEQMERHLKGFGFLPNKVRNEFIAMMGEFAGTFMFLFFAFSATQVANAAAFAGGAAGEVAGGLLQGPNTPNLLYISLAFGFSLTVNAWVFFRITGGLFNPAVTLGMCLIGAVTWLRGALIVISQLLGSMAVSGVVSALFPGPLNVKTTLGGGTSVVRGLFIEMFLTAQLVFTIFMLAAEKHKATFIAPIGIGLSLFIAELSGVYYTGGSLNPARSFGPCVVLKSFEDYHWIYWVGPFLGSLVAVGFYRLVKVLEYETANPGQDFDEKEAENFNPDEDPATAEDVRRPDVGGGQSARNNGQRRAHRSPSAAPRRGQGYDGATDRGLASADRSSPPRSGSKRGSRSASDSAIGGIVNPNQGPLAGYAHQPHSHFPHDQSYYNGPDAENGAIRSFDRR